MMTPVKLLYIEDDAVDRRAFLRMVHDKGLPYDLTLAGTLAEARARLAEAQFNVIVADYHLPDGDSLQLFNEVSNTPFILLTGTLEEQLALRTLERGADDYLAKDPEQRHLEAVPFTVEKTIYRLSIREREQRLRRQLQESQEALKESEERLRFATETSHTGVWELDLQDHTARRSLEHDRIFGYSEPPSQWSYEIFLEHVLPEDRPTVDGRFRRAIETGSDWNFECRVRRADQQVRWIWAVGGRRTDATGLRQSMAGIVLDITERKHAEEALRAARTELALANAELEEKVSERTAKLQETVGELEHFSYTITHDMRAPLRAMQGLAGLLTEECAERLGAPHREYIRRIADSADRMDRLITDALQYSGALHLQPELEPVDSDALLRGILESYPNFHPPRAHIHIDNRLPIVLGNNAAMTQCFSNLLANAVKFVQPGKTPEIRVWAESTQSPESEDQEQPPEPFIRIWFEDQGIGIEKRYQDKIWEMFQQLDKSYEGTGIGLALVRKVMDRMGGKVGVESEPGHGSRFWVELKRASGPLRPSASYQTAHPE